MLWDRLLASFEDELEKISEFNLSGLSAQTAMSASQAPPSMPSVAYEKAKSVLDRYDEMQKISENLQFAGALLQNRPRDQSDTSQPVRDVKSLGAHAAGGAGLGALAGRMSFLPGKVAPAAHAMHNRTWYGTAAGAALGAAEYGRKKIQSRRHEKQASAQTPAGRLKAAKQVGSFATKIHGQTPKNPAVGKV